MKPRIFKRDGRWWLRYPYHVRMFELFGSTGPHRQRIIDAHVATEDVESWYAAVDLLQRLYREREIRT